MHSQVVLNCYFFSFGTSVGVSGWKVSDGSIRLGLERTCLLGRSQFLTSEEAAALGLHGATILLDGGLISNLSAKYPHSSMFQHLCMISNY